MFDVQRTITIQEGRVGSQPIGPLVMGMSGLLVPDLLPPDISPTFGEHNLDGVFLLNVDLNPNRRQFFDGSDYFAATQYRSFSFSNRVLSQFAEFGFYFRTRQGGGPSAWTAGAAVEAAYSYNEEEYGTGIGADPSWNVSGTPTHNAGPVQVTRQVGGRAFGFSMHASYIADLGIAPVLYHAEFDMALSLDICSPGGGDSPAPGCSDCDGGGL